MHCGAPKKRKLAGRVLPDNGSLADQPQEPQGLSPTASESITPAPDTKPYAPPSPPARPAHAEPARTRPLRSCAAAAALKISAINLDLAEHESVDEVNWATLSLLSQGVQVRTSSIANAGLGLWADRDFAPYDIITEYTGAVISKKQMVQLTVQHRFQYVAQMTNDLYIDGFRFDDVSRACGSMANDPRDSKRYNSRLYASNPPPSIRPEVRKGRKTRLRLFLVAIRSIPKGSEVFFGYGKEYWSLYEQLGELGEAEPAQNKPSEKV